MVFFICEACGETLKKNKVDAHSWGCKNCWAFNCMDCQMRFEGEAYKEHMSCMSEAQKYQGSLFQAKENKGEVKQRSWIETVQHRLDSAPGGSQLRPFAERLLAYDNVPRKKAKFINFVKNSLNLKGDREGIAEKLWLLVEERSAPSDVPSDAEASAPALAVATTDALAVEALTKETTAAEAASAAQSKKSEASLLAVTTAKEEKQAAKREKKAAKRAAMDGAIEEAAAEAALAQTKKRKKGEAGVVVVAAGCGGDKAKKRVQGAQEDEGGTKPGAKHGKEAKVEAKDAKGEGKREKEAQGDVQEERGLAKQAKGGEKREKKAKAEAKEEGKPVKWKKIIAKELESEGGSMKHKELRTASIKEALAHPSHAGREGKELRDDFDAAFLTFTGIKGKFVLDGEQVRIAERN